MNKMNKKKRTICITAVIFTLILGSAAFIMASSASFPCRGFSHNGDLGDHVLKCMDKKIQELNLNEEQQDVYEGIKQDIKESMASCKEKRKVFKDDIREVLNDENPDPEIISDLVKDKISNVHQILSENMDRMVELYNILDDEQKQIVIEHMKERLNSCSRS